LIVLWLIIWIENGRVTLTVDGEFEVKLGVINDNLSSSWHVYQIKLFLRDTEEPGRLLKKKDLIKNIFLCFFSIEQELVHPFQVDWIFKF